MPSRRPDLSASTRSRRAGAWSTALVLAVGPVAGCSLGESVPEDGRATTTGAAPDRRQVVRGVQRMLDARAEAVRSGDRGAFLATVAPRPADRAEQVTYADNLALLPVAEYSLRLRPRSLRGSGDRWAGAVAVRMRLAGYDAAPVTRLSRVDVRRVGRRWLVVSDHDEEWQEDYGGDVQPWRTGPVEVVEGDGVLGVFDEGSVADATAVVDVVEDGVDDVAARVPGAGTSGVVVYALSDTDMLRGLPQLPGDDPDALDAVAFPVVARPGGSALAGTRFLLHPRMLDSDPGELARLVRHELTHVVLAERDDRVPVWLAEGVAEWVSVQSLPEDERVVSGAAVAAAQSGEVALPADGAFNGADAEVNYGIAWWAVQTIVDVYGEERLWALLDTLARTPADRQDEALEEQIGMDEEQLAEEAARRILRTYG